jgi:hypothetical protein
MSEAELLFQKHFYRALLQKFLCEHYVDEGGSQWSVKSSRTHTHALRNDTQAADTTEPKVPTPAPARRGLSWGQQVNSCASGSFAKYTKAALARLNLPLVSLVEGEDDEAGLERYRLAHEPEGRQQISIFWALRAVLAPLAEALILVDRFLFLEESGARASLAPLFAPTISPRNFALVGWWPEK